MAAVILFALMICPPPVSGAETAHPQPYPSRLIRIIVGQQPGTPSDIIARLVAQKLTELWSQSVVVENQPGASGTIGAELVAKAPADGYTLLVASHSNLVLAKVTSSNLRYDPLLDFAPIGRIAYVPFALAGSRQVPANTIPELVALAKLHPGQLTYSTAGSGTMSQFAIEMLKAAAGIDLLAVHYKGASSALVDVLAGRVDMTLADYAALAPHVRSGTVKILGFAGQQRSAAAPDVPTIGEQGIDGFAVNSWYGLVAPAKTPQDVLTKLNGALSEIRRMPDVRKRLDQLGYDLIDDSPAQFRVLIGSEIEKYSELVKRSGLKLE
jgi:tripartite-type tricarboxylate transporter receptor subunit TctC